jgi:hypothetical protein
MSRPIVGMESLVGGESDGCRMVGVGKVSAGSGIGVGAFGVVAVAMASGVLVSGAGCMTAGWGVGVKVGTSVGCGATALDSEPWATEAAAPMPEPI